MSGFHFVSQDCRQLGCFSQGYMDIFAPYLEKHRLRGKEEAARGKVTGNK